jgi:fibronectin-binding autotransporter adhesin
LQTAGQTPIMVDQGVTATISAPITGSGQVQKLEAGTLILSGQNSFTGGTLISAGAVQVTTNQAVGTGTLTLDGGTFQAGAAGLAFGNAVAINATGGTIDTQANTLTLSGGLGTVTARPGL